MELWEVERRPWKLAESSWSLSVLPTLGRWLKTVVVWYSGRAERETPGRGSIITRTLHSVGPKDAHKDAIAALGTILGPKHPAYGDALEKERSKSWGMNEQQWVIRVKSATCTNIQSMHQVC